MHENAIYTCNLAKFVEIFGFCAEILLGTQLLKMPPAIRPYSLLLADKVIDIVRNYLFLCLLDMMLSQDEAPSSAVRLLLLEINLL